LKSENIEIVMISHGNLSGYFNKIIKIDGVQLIFIEGYLINYNIRLVCDILVN